MNIIAAADRTRSMNTTYDNFEDSKQLAAFRTSPPAFLLVSAKRTR